MSIEKNRLITNKKLNEIWGGVTEDTGLCNYHERPSGLLTTISPVSETSGSVVLYRVLREDSTYKEIVLNIEDYDTSGGNQNIPNDSKYRRCTLNATCNGTRYTLNKDILNGITLKFWFSGDYSNNKGTCWYSFTFDKTYTREAISYHTGYIYRGFDGLKPEYKQFDGGFCGIANAPVDILTGSFLPDGVSFNYFIGTSLSGTLANAIAGPQTWWGLIHSIEILNIPEFVYDGDRKLKIKPGTITIPKYCDGKFDIIAMFSVSTTNGNNCTTTQIDVTCPVSLEGLSVKVNVAYTYWVKGSSTYTTSESTTYINLTSTYSSGKYYNNNVFNPSLSNNGLLSSYEYLYKFRITSVQITSNTSQVTKVEFNGSTVTVNGSHPNPPASGTPEYNITGKSATCRKVGGQPIGTQVQCTVGFYSKSYNRWGNTVTNYWAHVAVGKTVAFSNFPTNNMGSNYFLAYSGSHFTAYYNNKVLTSGDYIT